MALHKAAFQLLITGGSSRCARSLGLSCVSTPGQTLRFHGIDGVAVGLCQGTPVTAMLGGDLTPPVVRVYSTLTLQVGTL